MIRKETDLSVARVGVQQVRPGVGVPEAVWIYVKYQASVLQPGHQARWYYAGQQAEPETGDVIDGTGFIFEVVNARELSHTVDPGTGPWYVWGEDVYGQDYPATYTWMPVGGGGVDQTHKTDFYAWTRVIVKADGTLTYQINEMGSHDGVCEGVVEPFASIAWKDNATETAIINPGVPELVAGGTTALRLDQSLMPQDNRLVYDGDGGDIWASALLTATLIPAGNNQTVGILMRKNGTTLLEGPAYASATQQLGEVPLAISASLKMTKGDYVEAMVANLTGSSNIRLQFGHIELRGRYT